MIRRRIRVLGLAIVCGALAACGTQSASPSASAPSKPNVTLKVGILKLTSSAPVFLGMDKGFFRDEGIIVEPSFFTAAQEVADALAGGSVDVCATGITAGVYNLAAGGKPLLIVADKGREWPEYHLTALVINRANWDAGIRTLKQLKGKSVGITTTGSTFDYMLGNLLELEGMKRDDVETKRLQTLPAEAAAIQSKQVDAVLIPEPNASQLQDSGAGRIALWVGDKLKYQVATIMYSPDLAKRRDVALAFMRGYVRSTRAYYDAVLKPGVATAGPAFDEVTSVTAKYTGQKPEVIKKIFPYMDRNGELLKDDIGKQVRWFSKVGQLRGTLDPAKIVDNSFQREAVRQLGP